MQNGDSDGKKKNFAGVAHFFVRFFAVVFLRLQHETS